MSEPQKIFVSSEMFREQVNVFTSELISYIQDGKDYPISRIFDILPLTPENDETQQAIIARGDLHISGNTINNAGDLIIATFNDAAVGEVELNLSEQLIAQVKIDGDTLTLDFTSAPILVGLFSQQYELLVVTFSSIIVTYLFRERSDEDNQILLVSNLDSNNSLTQIQAAAEKSYFEHPLFNLLVNALVMDGSCLSGTVDTTNTGECPDGSKCNIGSKCSDGSECLSKTTWDVRKNTMNGACIVVNSKARNPAFPTTLGHYSSESKAKIALKEFKQEDVCSNPDLPDE